MDAGGACRSWEVEANALRDPAADGWEIEGPFQMSPKVAGMLKLWFVGYGQKRKIQQTRPWRRAGSPSPKLRAR